MLDADGQRGLRSVVVVHDDKIVYERYHPTDDDTSIMASFSVAKSFVSTLVGLLVEDGLLALDQPAPVELWSQPDDPRSAITIENLLHMSSGLAWNETYQPQGGPSDVISILGAYDSLEYAASKPLEAPPGSVWKYSSGTTSILSGIISDVLGGPDAVDEYLWSRLLDPIGITSTVLQREPSGKWIGLMGADSTTRDFARFGLLFLHDGYWGDVRVLPDGWVDYARTPAPSADYYGAQWWIEDGEMVARGLWGQTVHVSPSRDLVIAVNRDTGVGSIQNAQTELIASILEQFEPNAN
jgi:CubicO group peptidase (beta-lactamase class C family)